MEVFVPTMSYNCFSNFRIRILTQQKACIRFGKLTDLQHHIQNGYGEKPGKLKFLMLKKEL
jgi:hypothetical protein